MSLRKVCTFWRVRLSVTKSVLHCLKKKKCFRRESKSNKWKSHRNRSHFRSRKICSKLRSISYKDRTPSYQLSRHAKSRGYRSIKVNMKSCMKSSKIWNRRMKRRYYKFRGRRDRLKSRAETMRRLSRLNLSWAWWGQTFRSRRLLTKWRRSTCKRKQTGLKDVVKTSKLKSGSCVRATPSWAPTWSSSNKNMRARANKSRLSKRLMRITKTKSRVCFQRMPRGINCWVSTISGFWKRLTWKTRCPS